MCCLVAVCMVYCVFVTFVGEESTREQTEHMHVTNPQQQCWLRAKALCGSEVSMRTLMELRAASVHFSSLSFGCLQKGSALRKILVAAKLLKTQVSKQTVDEQDGSERASDEP